MEILLYIVLGYIVLGILFMMISWYDFLLKKWSFNFGQGWVSNWIAYPICIICWPFFVKGWYRRNIERIWD